MQYDIAQSSVRRLLMCVAANFDDCTACVFPIQWFVIVRWCWLPKLVFGNSSAIFLQTNSSCFFPGNRCFLHMRRYLGLFRAQLIRFGMTESEPAAIGAIKKFFWVCCT